MSAELPPNPQPSGERSETNGSIGDKLSTETVAKISLLAVVGVISIFLLVFGDFEGKVARVISTLVLFAVFTFFSSYKMSVRKSPLHTYLLHFGNCYMLLISLVLIWGTLFASKNSYGDWGLLPMTLFIVVLVQLGVLAMQRISVFVYSEQKQLSLGATLAMVGLGAAAILFTLPIGLNDFTRFSEGYWKFAIADILFTGLMLSIVSLIVWAFSRTSNAQNNVASFPMQSTPMVPKYGDTKPLRESNDYEAAPVMSEPAPAFQSVEPAKPQAPQFARPVPSALPWPVFPNGQPLPARSNGRPDFNALKTLAQFYAESEQQFFG